MDHIRVHFMILRKYLYLLDLKAKELGLSRSAMLSLILADYFNGGD